MNPNNLKNGLTLIEVMISLVILAILSITTLVAIPYARYMVVNSAIEQSAIHSGSSEIERRLNYPDSVQLGAFNTDGWTNTVTATAVIKTNSLYPDGNHYEDYRYLVISNTFIRRDGRSFELITYRSLEVPSNQR